MDMREQIMEAALRVYAEHGYRGATTRRIAQEAGVNEVTLFRHFGSKSQLIHEAIESAVPVPEMPALPERPRDPGTELRAWARVHLAHLFAMRSFIRTAIGECEEHAEIGTSAGERTRRVGVELRAYLGRVKAAGLCGADCDVEAAAIMLMGVLFADAMSRDIMPDMFPHAAERSVDEYVDLFLRAIGGKGATSARVESETKAGS
jgi:AcrR family transcriptional regulator